MVGHPAKKKKVSNFTGHQGTNMLEDFMLSRYKCVKLQAIALDYDQPGASS